LPLWLKSSIYIYIYIEREEDLNIWRLPPTNRNILAFVASKLGQALFVASRNRTILSEANLLKISV